MRFLLDAQLSRQLVMRLRQAGHDASHVFDHLDPQADDQAIAALANHLGACVVSKDADFVDMARQRRLSRTLVWIRVPNLANDLLWLCLEKALPAIESAVHEGTPIVEVFQDS
jgi:predicted nuclease of predicted toxin-antitoxin system